MRMRFWKILVLVGCAVLVFAVRSYAGPKLMNFQGKLSDSAGNPLSGTYSVVFSIYNASSAGSQLWTETQSISISSGANGIYNALLGSVNPINIDFNGDYWLGITVGPDSEMTPRFRLAAVPFAFSADKLYCYDSSDVQQGTIKAASYLAPSPISRVISGIGYYAPWHMFFSQDGTTLYGAFGIGDTRPILYLPGDVAVHNIDVGNSVNAAYVYAGNINATTLNVSGTKNFVQPYPGDPTKEIVYTSLEGPEAGTYCRGRGKLENGMAVIQLPGTFPLVTSAKAIITAQATPRGDCKGLYVAEASPTKIVVKELQGGKSNVEFDYLVQGMRKGYENNPVIRERTKTKALPGKPQEAK